MVIGDKFKHDQTEFSKFNFKYNKKRKFNVLKKSYSNIEIYGNKLQYLEFPPQKESSKLFLRDRNKNYVKHKEKCKTEKNSLVQIASRSSFVKNTLLNKYSDSSCSIILELPKRKLNTTNCFYFRTFFNNQLNMTERRNRRNYETHGGNCKCNTEKKREDTADVYRSLLGPTPDESILAGLQTVIDMCGILEATSHLMESRNPCENAVEHYTLSPLEPSIHDDFETESRCRSRVSIHSSHQGKSRSRMSMHNCDTCCRCSIESIGVTSIRSQTSAASIRSVSNTQRSGRQSKQCVCSNATKVHSIQPQQHLSRDLQRRGSHSSERRQRDSTHRKHKHHDHHCHSTDPQQHRNTDSHRYRSPDSNRYRNASRHQSKDQNSESDSQRPHASGSTQPEPQNTELHRQHSNRSDLHSRHSTDSKRGHASLSQPHDLSTDLHRQSSTQSQSREKGFDHSELHHSADHCRSHQSELNRKSSTASHRRNSTRSHEIPERHATTDAHQLSKELSPTSELHHDISPDHEPSTRSSQRPGAGSPHHDLEPELHHDLAAEVHHESEMHYHHSKVEMQHDHDVDLHRDSEEHHHLSSDHEHYPVTEINQNYSTEHTHRPNTEIPHYTSLTHSHYPCADHYYPDVRMHQHPKTEPRHHSFGSHSRYRSNPQSRQQPFADLRQRLSSALNQHRSTEPVHERSSEALLDHNESAISEKRVSHPLTRSSKRRSNNRRSSERFLSERSSNEKRSSERRSSEKLSSERLNMCYTDRGNGSTDSVTQEPKSKRHSVSAQYHTRRDTTHSMPHTCKKSEYAPCPTTTTHHHHHQHHMSTRAKEERARSCGHMHQDRKSSQIEDHYRLEICEKDECCTCKNKVQQVDASSSYHDFSNQSLVSLLPKPRMSDKSTSKTMEPSMKSSRLFKSGSNFFKNKFRNSREESISTVQRPTVIVEEPEIGLSEPQSPNSYTTRNSKEGNAIKSKQTIKMNIETYRFSNESEGIYTRESPTESIPPAHSPDLSTLTGSFKPSINSENKETESESTVRDESSSSTTSGALCNTDNCTISSSGQGDFNTERFTQRKTRYAYVKVTEFDNYTTYEVLNTPVACPKQMSGAPEGVFVVRKKLR